MSDDMKEAQRIIELTHKISDILFTELPNLKKLDMKSTAEAELAMAMVMGCLLATVLSKEGEEAYATAIMSVVKTIKDHTYRTMDQADKMRNQMGQSIH